MIPIDVRAAGVDFLCCGTYKWVLGGFGVAPFFIRRELLDRIRLDRFGALHVAKELPNDRFELHATAKRFDYATLPFAEVYQLGAGLQYVERVGVSHRAAHGRARARPARRARGTRLSPLHPEGTRSSIVTYYIDRDPAEVKRAFEQANVAVSVRDTKRQVRVSPALFNTRDDIDRFLDIAQDAAVSSAVRVHRLSSPLSNWDSPSASPRRCCVRYRPGMYTGSTERLPGTLTRLEVPHPGVVCIFNFGTPYRVTDPRDGRSGSGWGASSPGCTTRTCTSMRAARRNACSAT